jgi:hypothetical protein
VRWLRRKTVIAFVLLAILPVLAITVLFMIPRPETLSVIKARSEFVATWVIAPPMSAVAIGGMKAGDFDPKGSEETRCIEGLLTPPHGSRVTYFRYRKSDLSIRIESLFDEPATVRTDAGRREALPKDVRLTVDKSCPGSPPDRLPVWGPAQLGEVQRAASSEDSAVGMLLDGEVKIYGRSVEWLPVISWVLAKFGSHLDRTLYPTVVLPLPPGSRVEAARTTNEAAQTPWWGIVQIDADDGMTVQITTEAENLSVFPPGTTVRGEMVRVGKFAQLTSDPTLVGFQIYGAVLAFALDHLLNYLSAAETRPRRKAHVHERSRFARTRRLLWPWIRPLWYRWHTGRSYRDLFARLLKSSPRRDGKNQDRVG